MSIIESDLERSQDQGGSPPAVLPDSPDNVDGDQPQQEPASAATAENKTAEARNKKLAEDFRFALTVLFGTALPVAAIGGLAYHCPTRLAMTVLSHPVETAVELFMLLSVPFINYYLWKVFRQGDYRFSFTRGAMMGSSIGTSLIVATLSLCAKLLPQFQGGYENALNFDHILFVFLGAAVSSLLLLRKFVLTRDFKGSQRKIMSLTAWGTGISLLAVAGAEIRPALIKQAEIQALSSKSTIRDEGMRQLRLFNPERELLMECSTPQAFGLSGLLMPVKTGQLHQLYFAVTGRPFDFKDIKNQDLSSMPDDYLSRNVVGDKLVGMEMVRSTISGKLHPNSLSSTIEWTFVLKNSTDRQSEARAEVSLPPGAVVTDFTVWKKGEPRNAVFTVEGAAKNISYAGRSGYASYNSSTVTDLGHGRVLLTVDEIPADDELRAKLTVAMPLRPEGVASSKLELPRMVAQNFDIGEDNTIHLISNGALHCDVKELNLSTTTDGTSVLSGSLKREQLDNANLLVTAARSSSAPIAVMDRTAMLLTRSDEHVKEEKTTDGMQTQKMDLETLSVCINGSRNIKQQLMEVTQALEERRRHFLIPAKKLQHKPVPERYLTFSLHHLNEAPPSNLVVVVDGSSYLNKVKPEIIKSLSSIPANIKTKVIIAEGANESCKTVSVADAVKSINSRDFIGGQDNLKAVVKASEMAGETKSGAVVWLHGPQPHLNREIYIMAPYVGTPGFYDMQLGDGDVDTTDYFRNNKEVGPFTSVPRTSKSVAADFNSFISRWSSDKNFVVGMNEVSKLPANMQIASGEVAKELLALHAGQQVEQLTKAHHFRKASREALAYGIVSSLTSAVVTSDARAARDIDDVAKQTEAEGKNNTVDSVLFSRAILKHVPAATLQEGDYSNEPDGPELQGSTNGTIGPQGTDAAFVTGVNSAGTVRVNNLANLEALLNICANLCEIAGIIVGALLVLHGIFVAKGAFKLLGREFELSLLQRVSLGVFLIMGGLAVPGLINFFVASARDANLFS